MYQYHSCKSIAVIYISVGVINTWPEARQRKYAVSQPLLFVCSVLQANKTSNMLLLCFCRYTDMPSTMRIITNGVREGKW